MASQHIKYFSLEEANLALETLRPMVTHLMDLRSKILKRQPEAWPAIEKSAGNGGNKIASQLTLEFDQLDRIVHQIQDSGVELKDINTGLLDFRSIRDGQEVYLCWRYGENEIAFWHEIEAGFSGRKPI